MTGAAVNGRPTGDSAVTLADIRTRDSDLAVETARRIAEHRAQITVDDPRAVDFRISTAQSPTLSVDVVSAGGVRYVTTGEPIDFLLAGTLERGRIQLRAGNEEVRLARRDGFLYPLENGYHSDCSDPALIDLRIPSAYVAQLAEELTGIPAAALRFRSLAPVSAPMGEYWAATVRFIAGRMHAAEGGPPPLIVDQLLRLGASAVLAVFPNTSMTTGPRPETATTATGVVRRAVAFIEACADQPLTAEEIAAAVGLGVRSVQLAFRRQLDTTPMAYLRRVRLERARQELQDADPGTGVTVANTARRWGYLSPSRFAGDYRAAFRESPGHTLRS
ncbi:helix-turn-helix transcriptional regulator [Symbioplanes lichenis]|uniref:helix-turn-helix transcriptional regulator n=1 Tax=Symbioplanes lichenis TaxID=1629072 RepID=UPI0027387A2A|nr:AraC family transcriptional regulator [Actinoplanes lichenis]